MKGQGHGHLRASRKDIAHRELVSVSTIREVHSDNMAPARLEDKYELDSFTADSLSVPTFFCWPMSRFPE
jgi:hypothetical protein